MPCLFGVLVLDVGYWVLDIDSSRHQIPPPERVFFLVRSSRLVHRTGPLRAPLPVIHDGRRIVSVQGDLIDNGCAGRVRNGQRAWSLDKTGAPLRIAPLEYFAYIQHAGSDRQRESFGLAGVDALKTYLRRTRTLALYINCLHTQSAPMEPAPTACQRRCGTNSTTGYSILRRPSITKSRRGWI